MEYPLPHQFEYKFALQVEDETKNSAIFTLLMHSEQFTAPDAIEVNPKNAAFAVQGGPTVYPDSIIPRITMSMRLALSKTAVETDGLRSLLVNWMPLYTAFLPTLDAEDSKTAEDIEDILELQHETDDKNVTPLFSGVDLGIGSQADNTIQGMGFAQWNLTTDLLMESVAFDKSKFYDAMHYYTNKGMLKKVTGRMNTALVTRDRPYRYFSRNFTNPTVKRSNGYMFCGILVHLPQVGEADQVPLIAGDTTVVDHLRGNIMIQYDEWNSVFAQDAI